MLTHVAPELEAVIKAHDKGLQSTAPFPALSYCLIDTEISEPQNRNRHSPDDQFSTLGGVICFSLVKNLPFVDGNMRTAADSVLTFLVLNRIESILTVHAASSVNKSRLQSVTAELEKRYAR